MILAFVIAACLSVEPPPPPVHRSRATATRHHDPAEANEKFAPLRAREAVERKHHHPPRATSKK